jgi:anaphase-promoting complex subunit 10
MGDFTVAEVIDASDCRELGGDAILTISSAKPGNGVEKLRDNNLETYWQSDGSYPHFINIQYLRKVCISKVCCYLDYGLDESYTPKKVSIAWGTSSHDMVDIVTVELKEPVGWVTIPVSDPNSLNMESSAAPLKTHMLQVKILSMHQNGRDTHIRQLKILGPRESQRVMGGLPYSCFKSVEMLQYATIR